MKKIIILFVLLGIKTFSQQRDLPYYLQKAQASSPLLADYSNQIQAAKLDSLLARATYRPQVSVNANASYAPVINGYGYDTALSNGQVISGLVGVSQKIPLGNEINVRASSFMLISEALALNKKVAVRDLNKAITTQYIAAWGTAKQIKYSQKTVALLKEQHDILKKLTQNSIYKQTDFLIFSAAEKEQELTDMQLKQQYQNDIALLNYLSGESENTTTILESPDLHLVSNEKKTNVFLKQFETDSLKLQNSNRIIAAGYKPSLSLLADAGYNSTLHYEAYKNFGMSLGLGLTIPVYDGKQRQLQYQKNAAAMQTINTNKTNFKRQYKQQIYMLELKLQQADETAAFLKSQFTVAEALIEANKKLLISGDAQISEYIIALRNLVTIQNGMAQNNVGRMQTINELNYWNSDE